jgi:DDHD domain
VQVNWRLTLSFEDGGYRDETTSNVDNDYNLQDITPSTLPSVRNIVSDVMLDIPYYLTTGYHDKMVAAVIREANRIYHLWCVNNPGFAQHGKVHLIAHSLGSVMAIDILSSQPTYVQLPKPIKELSLSDLPTSHFAFDVQNLFLAGSPAGFFLLLKQTGLLPRHGHRKAGVDEDDTSSDSMPGVTGERGTYGCLPVDNVYNIVNPYDPVAYCLNAAVDANYAAALKQALVPNSAKPWLSFLLRSGGSAANASSRSVAGATAASSTILKPSATTRLPSTVEMETHNFTREEIAERKAYLLNDNGQIDFFLRYGGGPLEIQYLTMLGAHSSYWVNQDFIRLLVSEIGRPKGRAGTLVEMRAVKKKKL